MNRRVALGEENIIPRSEAFRLSQMYGNFSLGHSTGAQSTLKHFGDSNGYIAFDIKSGFVVALGDPVCSPNRRLDYLGRFIAAAGKPSFMQIGRETAQALSSLGYPINKLGLETHLPLGRDMFCGSQYQTLRYSATWLAKRNYTVVEVTNNAGHLAQIAGISQRWRQERIIHRREMSFLNRPFALALTQGMRRYLLIGPDGDGVAFLDLDPLYLDGICFGYTTSFKRRAPDAPAHAEVGLTKLVADILTEEGLELLSFGLSPLAQHAESPFAQRRIWDRGSRWAYSSRFVNRKYFNVQGHAAFKRRFHGIESPSFMAIGRGGIFEVIAQLRLIKLI